MAYPTRLWNDPLATGCVVKEKIRCGKKNCKCYTKSEFHSAYYLHYREYTFNPQSDRRTKFSSMKKKKYISKDKVSDIVREIKISKAGFIYGKLPTKIQIALQAKCNSGDEMFIEAYNTYLRSIGRKNYNVIYQNARICKGVGV